MGIYNDHPILVSFNASASKWQVLNSDLAPMPLGAAFNVMDVDYVTGPSGVHLPRSADTTGAVTELPLPGGAGTIALVTELEVSFVHDPHPTGLAWAAPLGPPFIWYLVNLDGAEMPHEDCFSFVCIPGPGFLVFVASSAPSAFRHVASDITLNWTTIDSPLLNDQPDALVFVTSVGFSDAGPPHQLGVWYDGSRWAIFNQDGAAMEAGATFNVVVVNPIFADGFESGSTSAWSGAVP